MSVKTCTSCKKQVYPVEEFKFSDHLFHKGCFRCSSCNLQLNIKNGKLADGKPYCTTHYPTVHSFAVVSDTPEIQRVQKNMAVASQTHYKGQQDKKAEQERRRANMENAPAIPAKPTRQVGSIADFDPVAAEKSSTQRGPAAAAASGTVVYSSAGTPAPASATPTPTPPAVEAATTTKSGYGRSGGYGRSAGTTPAATATAPTGQRTSTIDAPSAAPAPATTTVTEVQSVSPRPASVQQQPTPPPVIAASNTPPPALQPQPQQADTGAGVRTSASPDVGALSQDVAARLSVGVTGDRTSLPAAAPPAAPTAPAPAAQPPAATTGPCFRAIYDYDATDDDEVAILVDDILIEPEQIDEGWMYATNQRTGKRGMLPSNYVEPI